MSDGGLLQKAMDVQQPADEVIAVAVADSEKKTLIPILSLSALVSQ